MNEKKVKICVVEGKHAIDKFVFEVIVEKKNGLKLFTGHFIQLFGKTFKDTLNEALLAALMVAKELRVRKHTPVLVYQENLGALVGHMLHFSYAPEMDAVTV